MHALVPVLRAENVAVILCAHDGIYVDIPKRRRDEVTRKLQELVSRASAELGLHTRLDYEMISRIRSDRRIARVTEAIVRRVARKPEKDAAAAQLKQMRGRSPWTSAQILDRFVIQGCKVEPGGRVLMSALNNALAIWCEKKGYALPNLTVVGRYLTEAGFEKTKSNGEVIRRGLRLK